MNQVNELKIIYEMVIPMIRILKFSNIYRIQTIIVMLLLTVGVLHAENVTGNVYYIDKQGDKQPITSANIHFSGSSELTVTNMDGFFSIDRTGVKDSFLVATFTGFKADSLLIAEKGTVEGIEFVLKEGVQLSGVVVKAMQSEVSLTKLNVSVSELITTKGLMKMACCNLAESFENNATISVGFTDAVSGAKRIQMLGLSGIYSQMLLENIPTMRGLASSFGWSQTPASWLESIQISKGTSSVVNGYESITGQINLEFKKPDKIEDLYIDFFTDDVNEFEMNITGARKVSKNLWTNLLIHASTATFSVLDRNSDHFMSMPLNKFFNAFNRWLYVNPEKRIESRTGIKFLYEYSDGGQNPLCHKADAYFVSDIVNKDFTAYNKTGIFVGDKPGQSIAIINSFTHHELDSYFGAPETYKLYYGTQNSFYSNLLFSSYVGSPNNQYTVGASFLYDNYGTYFMDKLPENNTPLTPLTRLEVVPGVFGQYTYSYEKNFTLIAGLREDYNSKYGRLFTPRSNIKYNINDNIIFRASAGCGYRAPNVIADDIGLMASTRKFDIDAINGLQIEKAWNYGGNITFYVPVWDAKKLTLSLDYFHTNFVNEAVIDLDRDKNRVYFYNSTGKSYADAWQADASFTPFKRFDVVAAFRYNLSMETLSDGNQSYLLEKPLTSKFRGLINLAYATKFRKWLFDFTAQLNGPTRIPSLTGYTTVATESPTYPVLFTQITKNTKRLDFYVGVDNLLNYKQKNPIINAEDPFVKGFDASLIWGPLVGRVIYAGVRIRLGKQY
jgi:hypothetical protein